MTTPIKVKLKKGGDLKEGDDLKKGDDSKDMKFKSLSEFVDKLNDIKELGKVLKCPDLDFDSLPILDQVRGAFIDLTLQTDAKDNKATIDKLKKDFGEFFKTGF